MSIYIKSIYFTPDDCSENVKRLLLHAVLFEVIIHEIRTMWYLMNAPYDLEQSIKSRSYL